jgi:hypothetical protein
MIEIKEPTGIRDLGIDEEEFRQKSPTIVNFSANDLNTAVSPRTPATREFTTILEYMLKEKPIDFQNESLTRSLFVRPQSVYKSSNKKDFSISSGWRSGDCLSVH